MNLRQTATAGIFSLLVLLSLGVTANARDWGDLPTYNNNTFAAQAASAANLNMQRSQLQTRIDAALNAGQISFRQATDLKAQLANNEHRQWKLSVDGLSYANVQSLLAELNSVDAQIQSDQALQVNERAIVAPRGPRIDAAAIDAMKARISARMEQGRASGRLSAWEYNSMRRDLDDISMHENRMLSYRAHLSSNQANRLQSMLNGLEHELRAQLSDRDYSGRDHRWY